MSMALEQAIGFPVRWEFGRREVTRTGQSYVETR